MAGPRFPASRVPPAYDFRTDVGASAWQFEPWAEVTHRAYAGGELPLWNPYQGAGAPLAANMSSAVFDPLLLAVNLHPTALTWDLSILGAFILGAAAAYLFGRVLGLRVVPAVVGSAAFSLSGWFFLYSNNQFSRSYVFIPLLFLLVELSPALAAAVARLRARRRLRREHLHGDARGDLLRDRHRLRIRGGAARPGAKDDADAGLARPDSVALARSA